MLISTFKILLSHPHLTTRCARWRPPFGLVRGLRKIRDKARAKKATNTQMARVSREIERADRKAAREDTGIVHDGNVRTTRELNACLKIMSDEWNEQVPEQMRTFLEGKWDGQEQDQRNQLKLATHRRLARSPCTNTTHSPEACCPNRQQLEDLARAQRACIRILERRE